MLTMNLGEECFNTLSVLKVVDACNPRVLLVMALRTAP